MTPTVTAGSGKAAEATDPRREGNDAVLLAGFGGPEGPDDVMPFLRNVTRGRGIPEERLVEVSHHYQALGGASPINEQNRALKAALEGELDRRGIQLPVLWGNRNWAPYIKDVLQEAHDAGYRRLLMVTTSVYSCYSSCRQYREDIERARATVGEGAPRVDKLRSFYNHPGFVAPNAENLRAALAEIPEERRTGTHVAFTAHSIPSTMAAGCDYANGMGSTLSSSAFPTKTTVFGNIGRFSDPAVDAAINTLYGTTDEAVVKEQVGVMVNAMMTQFPVLSILYAPARSIYRTEKAVGWPTAEDPYCNPQDNQRLWMTRLTAPPK